MPAVTSKTTDNILNAERVSFVVDYKKARPSVIRRRFFKSSASISVVLSKKSKQLKMVGKEYCLLCNVKFCYCYRGT